PNTARKMLHMFKVVDKMLDWENAGKTKLLSVGYSLRAPELLFRKIEDEEISYQLEKLRNNSLAASVSPENKTDTTVAAPANNPQPPAFKPAIQFDDFAKIDLRTGTIVSAEKVEKADKLLKLSIDLGSEVRTIVSGIAQHFKPEDLSGQQVVVVANLAPRKMRGIESNGMILMASDEKGKLHFVRPQNKINPGAEIN
ncbi:MAG TPA: methionine--tRNA ligase subunit beta, partial [Flavihumibacter sp.]|nr:methionine--tRNA ligase subunit beta [Flavihumibacter sp.]